MAGLVPATYVFLLPRRKQGVGGRDLRAFTPVFDGLLPGHDDVETSRLIRWQYAVSRWESEDACA